MGSEDGSVALTCIRTDNLCFYWKREVMQENWQISYVCRDCCRVVCLPIIMMVVMMLHDACCGGDAGLTCIDVHLASTRGSTLHYHN